MRHIKLSFAAIIFLSFSLVGTNLNLEASDGLPSAASRIDKPQATRKNQPPSLSSTSLSLTVGTDSAGKGQATGKLTDQAGAPIDGAGVQLKITPLDGPGFYGEYTITGTIPAGTTTVLVGFRVNTECDCSGPSDFTIYQVRFTQGEETDNRVFNADFFYGMNGWGFGGPGTAQLEPSDRGTGQMLHVMATPAQDVGAQSLDFPVTAGQTYTATFSARVTPISACSGYFSVFFLSGPNGPEISRATIPLEPKSLELSSTTDSRGNFHFDLSGLPSSSMRLEASYAGDASHSNTSTTLTFIPLATTLGLSPSTDSLYSGEVRQFTATVKDQLGNVIPKPALTWTVSPGSLGTVSPDGSFTAGQQTTSGTVSAAIGSISAAAAVSVSIPVPSAIEISPATDSRYSMQIREFKAAVMGQLGRDIPNAPVTWSVSPPWLGRIDPDGTFTAGKHTGSGTVTTTIESLSASATVSVTKTDRQIWFAPLDPLTQTFGSYDFMDLFKSDAHWQKASSRVHVFKFYGGFLDQATDSQLKQAVNSLNQRGIALAIEVGPLVASESCPHREGFGGPEVGKRWAQQIKAAGGTLRFLAMDEPFFYANIYQGPPGACNWPAEKVAQEVFDYIQAIKSIFPDVVVGDIEPVLWSGTGVDQYKSWLETYHRVTGQNLPFLVVDLDWGNPNWPKATKELEDFCHQRGIEFGIIYTGDSWDNSDEAWLRHAEERMVIYERQYGGNPDHAFLQSWHDHPDYLLPETDSTKFTNLIDRYVRTHTVLSSSYSPPSAFALGSVTGILVDQNGAIIPSASVRLTKRDPFDYSGGVLVGTATTDVTGRYRIPVAHLSSSQTLFESNFAGDGNYWPAIAEAKIGGVSSPNCTFNLSSSEQAMSADDGFGTLSVSCNNDCQWPANSNSDWIAITAASEKGGPGNVYFRVSANPSTTARTGTLSIAGQTFTVTQAGSVPVVPVTSDLFVPIVLSTAGQQGSFFTSEMTLTNRGSSDAVLNLTYTSAFGGGSGVAIDYLDAGQQRIIPDTIPYLRSLGIPIPETGNRGGTLGVRFSGISSPSDGAVTIRTTTPVPNGRAGLAYAGMPRDTALNGVAYICGLRQNSQDRSNLALQNVGSSAEGEITLQLTVFSGDSSAPFSQTLPDVVLPPGGFQQISGILTSNGLSLANGFVRIEKIAGSAPYYAYGVINDQSNSDGSFIPPIEESSLLDRTRLTLPVIVEANQFTSELVATNWSDDTKTLHCSFVSDGINSTDSTARFDLELKPKQQMILSDLVQWLRDSGHTEIGPKGTTYAGPLIAEVATGDLSGISLAARTSAPGGGGRYGLFYLAVPNGMAATDSAWIFGLQQNTENRTNLALVNTGEVDASDDVFAIELYDGETGVKIHTLEGITLKARGWTQMGAILAPYGPTTTHGYAHIIRTSGSNPFIAYGVINDGGKPTERSGDGAFIASAP